MIEKFKGELKCNRCEVCNGFGCIGQLPGLGGVLKSENFQLNCKAWSELRKAAETAGKLEELLSININPSQVRCGPVTGSVENIGFAEEKDFYKPYLSKALSCGFGLCAGDGCPDEKLKFGIEAVKDLNTKAAFFLKPYPDAKLAERVSWVKDYAEFIGIDIDSYNIVTMRNLVNLERKTKAQLMKFRQLFDVPFVMKGVFTDDDVELVKDVKPDVVYISNHGGRVETRIGSSAAFLKEKAEILKPYCKEIWVDGGIRTAADVKTALYYGADKAIIARPLIRATFDKVDFTL